ncbi:MAG: Rieske 2Fe-2S domain-containing protein [Cyanobacteria bacterium P01_D01_bin.44]
MSMLAGAPWLLAHKSMLPVNQPVKVSLYGQDYVLWKDCNNDVHALVNICPHMGAMLSEGWCEAQVNGSSKVVCPFHALAFDPEGGTVLPGTNRETRSQLKPLELVIQGDFIWSYGDAAPKQPIPESLNKIAATYEFVGATADMSVETPLLPMLLNMHDYNHQNGTHRDLFRIEEVQFGQFIDQGHYSEAFFKAPTASPTWQEIVQNPAVLTLPKILEAHLENHFPSLVIFHGENAAGTVAQCHLFVPESDGRTRTYILLFAQPKSPLFKLIKGVFLKLSKTVVEQDAAILSKIYPDQPQKIKLNNEVGMDWVRRNIKSWPTVVAPNLSR